MLKRRRSILGTLHYREGHMGYVEADDGSIHAVVLDKSLSIGSNDKVVLTFVDNEEPVITNVLTKSKSRFVGVVEKVNDSCYLVLDDKVSSIKLDPDLVEDGDRIIYNTKDDEILAHLGNVYEPDSKIKEIVVKSNFNPEFSDEILEVLDKIDDKITDYELSRRLDLRKEIIFTIDGDDARDLDDAISLSINSDGNYMLGVHIADVSHYVKPGSIIDEEASYRTTSLYYSDRVIPMLPKILSNNLCSLNPNVDRLTVSGIMEISPSGEVIDITFMKSVINSKMRMSYKNVNRVLDDGVLVNDYYKYEDNLLLMNKLAKILQKRKNDAGKFSFDKEEVRFVLDDNSWPIDTNSKKQGTAESLIEIFMITCNEAFAEFTERNLMPNIYRIHGVPDPRKVVELTDFFGSLGYNFDIPVTDFDAKDITRLMNSISTLEEANVLKDKILRTLPRAEYKARTGRNVECIRNEFNHFGLASHKYTHFTSPIRRYADLKVHQILSNHLDSKYTSKQKGDDLERELKSSVNHINRQEKNADMFVEQVQHYQMCQYFSGRINHHFGAVISEIDSSGLKLVLSNGLTAKVYPENLEGNRIGFNYGKQKFIDLDGENEYKFGDKVIAKVLDANPSIMKLRFGVEPNSDKILVK